MKSKFLISSLLILMFKISLSNDTLKLSKSRNSFDILYNWSGIGTNLSLNVSHQFNKFSPFIGLNILTNSPEHVYRAGFAFRKKAYSDFFEERIGLNIGFMYHIKVKPNYLHPYFIFSSQFAYTRIKNTGSYNYFDGTSHVNYHYNIISDKFFITENTIGFGLKTKLNDKLFLNQSVNVGICSYANKNIYSSGIFKNTVHFLLEPSLSLRLGFTYKF